MKFYVVWEGIKTGIFSSWEETKSYIQNVKNAKYQSFTTEKEAQEAFLRGYNWLKSERKKEDLDKVKKRANEVIYPSVSVDASCLGNPGIMEYQGVYNPTGEILFSAGPFYDATVNIGEFLSIVHGLSWLKTKNSDLSIYSDSKTAISWVRNKKIKTNLVPNSQNTEVFIWINRALVWLKENSYETPILKWKTEDWGENPADFGRK